MVTNRLRKLWSNGVVFRLKMPRGKKLIVFANNFRISTLRTRFVFKEGRLIGIVAVVGGVGSLIHIIWIKLPRGDWVKFKLRS